MTKVNVNNKTNVMVRYLPLDITSSEFLELCKEAGEITSYRLVKDKETHQNIGYGFVNYCKPEDALKAVEILNNKKVSNKIIKADFAEPEAPKGINIFVSGLPLSTNINEVKSLFGTYGILSIRMILNEKANDEESNKAIAIIRLENKEMADRAINDLNNTVITGTQKPIKISYVNDTTKQLNRSIAEYIKGKPEVKMQFNKTNFIPKFASPFKAPIDLINKGINRYSPYDRIPSVSIPAIPGQSSQVLYIWGLDDSIQESDLWTMFGRFGSIESVRIVRDQVTRKTKGFGFVNMINYDEAVTAIRNLDGLLVNGRILSVSFKTLKSTNDLND